MNQRMNMPISMHRSTDEIVREIITSLPPRKPCIEVVDDDMAEILRQKTPAERLQIAWGMWRFARDTIRRVVADQHPDWCDIEIQREATRRLTHGSRKSPESADLAF